MSMYDYATDGKSEGITQDQGEENSDKSVVGEKLEILDKVHAALARDLTELIEILSPILQPAFPEPNESEKKDVDDRPRSPLYKDLEHKIKVVNAQVLKIRDVVTRIEL